MGVPSPVDYLLAIIGAGPAGLSAAARAAEIDGRTRRTTPSYILLEGSPKVAKTIQRYQKGKYVMAEPGFLQLRSDLRFGAGSRERVLDSWMQDASRLGINIRYNEMCIRDRRCADHHDHFARRGEASGPGDRAGRQ